MISQKPGWRRLTTSAISTATVLATYSDGPHGPTTAASGELNSSSWQNRPISATGHSLMWVEPSAANLPPLVSPATTAQDHGIQQEHR